MTSIYVVDTNVVSELLKPAPSQNVIDWFWDCEGSIYLNSITVKELYFGILRLDDGKRKAALMESVDGIVKDCADKTFAFDGFCGYLCAKMQQESLAQGRLPTIEDMMIASMAKRNDAVLATRNVKDFAHLDIDIINPFEWTP